MLSSLHSRDVMEIKDSERRARAQAKMYQTVLDEQSWIASESC